MNASFVHQKQHNVSHSHWLVWALIGSALLHLTLTVVIPHLEHEKKPKPKELKVELVKLETPKPAPEPVPEPPKPEPPKPEPPKPKPKPKPKPIKQKVVRKPKPKPLPPPETPPPVQPEPVLAPQPVEAPPPVITAAPTATAAPKMVVPEPPPPPPPPPPEPAGPSQADINAYSSQLHAEFRRNQRYPKMAQRRGVQGDVDLLIGLNASGGVTSVSIAKSSGSSVLDKEAIKTVKRSNIQRLMPDILKGKIDKITVTLSFKLQ